VVAAEIETGPAGSASPEAALLIDQESATAGSLAA
jgi:hypothetical protein